MLSEIVPSLERDQITKGRISPFTRVNRTGNIGERLA